MLLYMLWYLEHYLVRKTFTSTSCMKTQTLNLDQAIITYKSVRLRSDYAAILLLFIAKVYSKATLFKSKKITKILNFILNVNKSCEF